MWVFLAALRTLLTVIGGVIVFFGVREMREFFTALLTVFTVVGGVLGFLGLLVGMAFDPSITIGNALLWGLLMAVIGLLFGIIEGGFIWAINKFSQRRKEKKKSY